MAMINPHIVVTRATLIPCESTSISRWPTKLTKVWIMPRIVPNRPSNGATV
ncbi:MAG: hypothetical protein BWZ10_01130 [candidate division BRC1 bacterium ADurb.BinA364]|nr:MAG: hypothetical protein BWZ10_01130 [candidate division BRC1 bacterium ADurb.BinA364]